MRRPSETRIGEDADTDEPENDHEDGAAEVAHGHGLHRSPDLQQTEPSMEDVLPRLMQVLGKLLPIPAPPASTPKAEEPLGTATSRIDDWRVSRRARLSDAAEAARDGHTKTIDRVMTDLPVRSISGTRVENIRLEEDETAFRALCESLQKDGQLQPIVVVANAHRPGHYQPVAGFRRLRAATELGWPTIRAVVHPAGSSDQELFFLNAIENAQRFKLSDYELACRAQVMTARFGTPLADYARRLGLSPARVQNLVRFLEVLPADIIAAWRSGDPLMSDRMLQTLSAMPHDEASEYWAAWKATHATTAPRAGTRSRTRPRRSMERPTTAAVSRLWVAVRRKADLDENARDLILKVVDYCLGRSPTVPGLFDPRAGLRSPAPHLGAGFDPNRRGGSSRPGSRGPRAAQ